MINAIGVLTDLVYLALFSILLYPLVLTHVRATKIVIDLTPIVKDLSHKLRTKTNFSEKTGKYTTREGKCYQKVLFFKRSYMPVRIHYFLSNILVKAKMADEFHAEALRGLCCITDF